MEKLAVKTTRFYNALAKYLPYIVPSVIAYSGSDLIKYTETSWNLYLQIFWVNKKPPWNVQIFLFFTSYKSCDINRSSLDSFCWNFCIQTPPMFTIIQRERVIHLKMPYLLRNWDFNWGRKLILGKSHKPAQILVSSTYPEVQLFLSMSSRW